MEILFFSLMVLGIYIYCQIKVDKKKIQTLMSADIETTNITKYRDEGLDYIVTEEPYWVGQSLDQLIASIGKPHSIDSNVLKSSSKEVWKYKKQGDNRYSLRIVIENQRVVGFDQKA